MVTAHDARLLLRCQDVLDECDVVSHGVLVATTAADAHEAALALVDARAEALVGEVVEVGTIADRAAVALVVAAHSSSSSSMPRR
jgi:hypothetical protein